jgi:hypothetical protein
MLAVKPEREMPIVCFRNTSQTLPAGRQKHSTSSTSTTVSEAVEAVLQQINPVIELNKDIGKQGLR